MIDPFGAMDVRPYQLMAIVSRIGGGCEDDLGDPRLNEILAAVRANPGMPLALRCNVTTFYDFQNPGHGDDTPEGELHNARRDLKILQRMGLTPGTTKPAIDLFEHMLEAIESAEGILWFNEVTSEAWGGEPRDACAYEKGRAMGVDAIIPPRPCDEMARVKQESVRAIRKAETLEIRPHHLMCMTCFHGGREELAPIDEDNLFEAIDIIQQNPEIPVRLVCGPCMICPPCPYLRSRADRCIGGHGMALRDELKDLDVLQRLGMTYGDTMSARSLFARLYARIESARGICGYGDGVPRSRDWSVCGGEDVNARYAKGRAAGLGFVEAPAGPAQG